MGSRGRQGKRESRDAAEPARVRDYYRSILPFYELESVSHAHLAFWSGLIRDRRTGSALRVLELGSGFGRITTALSERSRAVGIDVCLEMLARASAAAASGAGVPRDRSLFVAADMRRPPFRGVFDLVVAPSDPFSHLTRLADRRRALAAVAGLLAPGGRFVLEGLYRRRVAMESPARRVRHVGGVLFIEEAWFPIGVHELWHARYRYRDRRPGRPDRRREAAFVARAWDPRGLRAFFGACGLTVDRVAGDFDGTRFTASSPRLLVFARRRRNSAAGGPR